MDITKVLSRRYPGTRWAQDGEDYSGLIWLDESAKPSEAELLALWPAVESEFLREQVEQDRALAYRETSDPIFFQYQRGDATEQEWLDAVQAVKDAHPYPETV
jgi:hypothetical protein